MMPEGFGRRIRQLRKAKKMTQTQLARKVGVHYIHIGRYERGKSDPNAYFLLRLARALGVTLDFLVYGKKPEPLLVDEELLFLFRTISTLSPQSRMAAKKLINEFLVELKKMAQGTV